MLKVLGRRNSANVQKVTWCLHELGLPFEQEEYGGSAGKTREPAYLRLNPNGTVPTLQDGDFTLWESNTILRYLCNAYGPTALYPQDAASRALVERWMDWQQAALWPGFMPLFLGSVRERRPLEDFADSFQRTTARLRILDAQLSAHAFTAGNDLTLADIALAPFVHRWFAISIPREPMPHLEVWYERLSGLDGFRQHVMIDF